VKPEVMNAILTAKILFDSCRALCTSRDRYLASAGLITLQDAFEIILYAALLELDKDTASLDKLTFDQLIGNLAKYGYTLERSGTLKAMNKMRVQVKHYAQVADSVMIASYYEACRVAVNSLATKVFGRSLEGIVIADAIEDEAVKTAVAAASALISTGEYRRALVECRKIVFLTIECEYDIAEWKNYRPDQDAHPLGILGRRYYSAPYYTRNAEWIQKNVVTPTDYIQIDHEQLRIELLEMGIDRIEFENLQHLTPKVYLRGKGDWVAEYRPELSETEHLARYCLDLAVSVALRKQMLAKLKRRGTQNGWRMTMRDVQPLLAAPDLTAARLSELAPGKLYNVERDVSSLNDNKFFAEIAHVDLGAHEWTHGYVPLDVGELTEYDQRTDG
jgi:hypothetical protein